MRCIWLLSWLLFLVWFSWDLLGISAYYHGTERMLTYLNSAFNAIISASVVALDISYGMPIMINVMRGRRMIKDSPWKMSEPLAWTANIVSIILQLCCACTDASFRYHLSTSSSQQSSSSSRPTFQSRLVTWVRPLLSHSINCFLLIVVNRLLCRRFWHCADHLLVPMGGWRKEEFHWAAYQSWWIESWSYYWTGPAWAAGF